jgi:PKD repeat protein
MAALCIATWCTAALAQEMEMAAPDASPTASGRMMIPEPLLVTVQATPGYGPAPLLVGFIVSALDPSGSPIVAYNWNFGDGHLSTLPPTLAFENYTTAGNYVATVTVTTADGRSATGFTGVTVKPGAGGTPQQREQNQ